MIVIDPEHLRELAMRFDWAFESGEGESVLDLDAIAELLRSIANGHDVQTLGDSLDLPRDEPSDDEE